MSRANPVYTAQVGHYRDQQQAFADSRSGDPDWLVGLRADAIAGFGEIGFPSTRLEEWKYTNVAALAKLSLEVASDSFAAGGVTGGVSLQDALLQDANALRERLARVPAAKDRAFSLLNAAFLADGAIVEIPKDAQPSEPIHLKIAAPKPGQARHPRVLVDAGFGSQATVVIEQEAVAAEALVNLVVDVEVAANASLELVLVQPGRPDDASFQISNLSARVGRDGRFTSHTLTAGGALVRNDLDVLLAEEGAQCNLRGLFLGSGSRVVDNHSSVDHAVPHCSSHELYKGILSDRSKGVFRGRVVVRPDAQKTDAQQSNPNLLLGPGAEIDTKPQLEIYADDVKCSHGATVGQLDEDAVFYLQSRGIGLDDARALMIRAFANEIIDAVPVPGAAKLVAAGLEALGGPDTFGTLDTRGTGERAGR